MTTNNEGFGPQRPAVNMSAASVPPLPPPAVAAARAGGSTAEYAAPLATGSAASTQSAAHSRRRLAWALAAVVVGAALIALAAGAFRSGASVTEISAPATARAAAQAQAGLQQPGVLSVAGQAPFVLHYPSDWTRLTAAQLARIANPPAAGLVAEGGRVLLLVRPKKPLTQPISTLSAQLTKSLSSRFADFKLLSTGTTRTLAGPAWVYTFQRASHALVQSEVVVATPSAAYEIDIALRGGANSAARQMGEIVHSFQR